jgi:hypothetical protein
MNQIFRFLPALRVHSWGGFGSQLFTAYLVLKLQSKFPNRRIKVVIHTSGVTRRISEFDFETLGVNIIQVEDYKATEVQNGIHKARIAYSYNLPEVIRGHLYQILQWLRLVQSANTDLSFNLISIWTLSIRGHYTRLSLDKSFVESLYDALFLKESPFITKYNALVVHYRLGDLLHLDKKQLINADRIEGVLDKLRFQTNHLILLSDSNEEELAEFLKSSMILKFGKLSNYGPNKTLRFCIDAESFVGTGAKISLWAAIFRYFIHEKESFLPTELSWSSGNGLKANWY